MTSMLGHNGPSEPEADELPVDLSTAELVRRTVEVLASAFGMYKQARSVLKKKQAMTVLSLRQLTVYCLTHENPDLAIVPIVKLANVIGYDRGTVRDDRAAVEKAAASDEALEEFLDVAREMVMGIPLIARGAADFFLGMDIARTKSRVRLRKLQDERRRRKEWLSQPTRGEIALRELGKSDLADQLLEKRKAEPWNPLTQTRPDWLRSATA